MINLRNTPFLWFALLLLLAYGLAALTNFVLDSQFLIFLLMICLVCGIVGIIRYKPGFQAWSSLAISLIIIAGGMIRATCFVAEIFHGEMISKSVRMQGMVRIHEVLKMKEHSTSLRCEQISLKADSSKNHLPYPDKFIVVQVRESNLPRMYPGDHLYVQGWVSSFNAPQNPYSFDIRKYYRSIGIRHQLSCKGPEVQIGQSSAGSLARLTAIWQASLCAIITKHTSPEVAQLTNALVWGDRTYMDEEIRNAFADSGAMHVLSVSGMHMAMIYSMLYLILGAPGSGSFLKRMSRFACYAIVIMLYMGLTGACPAVVRSGLMILLYLLGKAMGWNTQIWNLLGFAAFLMLWINPFVSLNIGFQLSFLAMAGILFYAKPMIRYFTFRQIIFHRTWEITAVSIAAQVFILPILLKQFYQFPMTFVVSSLVAMPASYVIIFGSLLNILLSVFGINWLWSWYDIAGKAFIMTMKWMAGLNPEMNFSLPHAAEMLLLAGAVLFSIALIYKWPPAKTIAYALGMAALIHLGCHRTKQWTSNELVLYHQYKGLLLDIIIDGRCVSIQDTSLTHTSVDFAARGNRCHKDVIHTLTIPPNGEYRSTMWRYTSNTLYLKDMTIVFWHGEANTDVEVLPVTHIVVHKCPNVFALKDFICQHAESTIILPAYLDRYPKNVLAKFLRENNIRFWDVSESGYFRLHL